MSALKQNTLFIEKAYINGEWLSTSDNIAVTNPSTQEEIGTVPNMGAAETTSAIEAAKASFHAWANMVVTDRQNILMQWHDLIIAHVEELAQILTMEQGKPLAEAKGEILNGAGFIKWYGEEARRVYGDLVPANQDDQRIMIKKQPVGVSAMITPWNFPSSMITRKAAAALAAGCPVVIKPSEFTPFSALALAVLAEKAGIPKGVFNIVTGDAQEIGQVLSNHDDVKKLSFTGSTRVGKLLMRQSADSVKKISLELGGNAPFIIFDDADIDKAVAGAIASKFRNAGQTCICANRIFVHNAIMDDFNKAFVAATEALEIGDGFTEGTQIGPLINDAAVEKTGMLLKDAIDQGATVLAGGKARDDLGAQYFEPTVITDVNDNMRCFKEEIFGPVAAVYGFDDDADVIRCANDTEYGLAAYIFTQSMERSWRVPEALDYGMVGVNSSLLSTPQAPFGGVKQSGFGREGSKYGFDDYIVTKYVSLQF